jgi:hypothetical protein
VIRHSTSGRRTWAGTARLIAIILCGTLPLSSIATAQSGCPKPDRNGVRSFDGGAFSMSTALAVNPDGSAASYTQGDHGFTYIVNGVNLLVGGKSIVCATPENQYRCRDAWLAAEASAFGPGTATFCVYALEAEPITASIRLTNCEGTNDRFVVGDGLGRPGLGKAVLDIQGVQITPYRSTTSIQYLVGGERRQLDSGSLPVLVVPRSRTDLLGSLVWLRHGSRGTFAVAGDVGPRFGEGSIALHQLLREGAVTPQVTGPIPLSLRCGGAERALRPPFQSKPDRSKDLCRTGYVPLGASDIRAYSGFDGEDPVISVVLPTKLSMKGEGSFDHGGGHARSPRRAGCGGRIHAQAARSDHRLLPALVLDDIIGRLLGSALSALP